MGYSRHVRTETREETPVSWLLNILRKRETREHGEENNYERRMIFLAKETSEFGPVVNDASLNLQEVLVKRGVY